MPKYKFTFDSRGIAAAEGLDETMEMEELCFAEWAKNFNLTCIKLTKNTKSNKLRYNRGLPFLATFCGTRQDIINFINSEILDIQDSSNEAKVMKAWKKAKIGEKDIHRLRFPRETNEFEQANLTKINVENTTIDIQKLQLIDQEMCKQHIEYSTRHELLQKIGYILFNKNLASLIAEID